MLRRSTLGQSCDWWSDDLEETDPRVIGHCPTRLRKMTEPNPKENPEQEGILLLAITCTYVSMYL